MNLGPKEVRHVAKLSAIEVSDAEVEKYMSDLNSILEYIDRLSEIPTRGVVPTFHVHGVVNAFRDDIIRDSLAVEEVAKNAPDFTANCFRVPKIL